MEQQPPLGRISDAEKTRLAREVLDELNPQIEMLKGELAAHQTLLERRPDHPADPPTMDLWTEQYVGSLYTRAQDCQLIPDGHLLRAFTLTLDDVTDKPLSERAIGVGRNIRVWLHFLEALRAVLQRQAQHEGWQRERAGGAPSTVDRGSGSAGPAEPGAPRQRVSPIPFDRFGGSGHDFGG